MARSKKTSRRRTSTPDIAVVTTVATPWERNRKVVRITRAIMALDRKTARTLVDATVRLGAWLIEVKDGLPHGEWLRWLDEGIHIDRSSAERYMGMSRWSRQRPREFARVRDLSLTKIYLLLPLAPEQRRRLYDRVLAIPGTNKRRRIQEMTGKQLGRVVRDLTAEPPPDNPIPALLKGAHHRLAGFEAHARELIEHRDEIDSDQVDHLHDKLLDLAQRLRKAFALPHRSDP